MLLIFGISWLLLSVGSFVLVRSITHSLNRLTQMIHNIAEGEGDVTRRLEAAGAFGNDELGEVSRLFNLFMDKLQELLRGVSAHTHKLRPPASNCSKPASRSRSNSGETPPSPIPFPRRLSMSPRI